MEEGASAPCVEFLLTQDEYNMFFRKFASCKRSCALCGESTHPTELCIVYRTKMCSHFQTGRCRFGDGCTFAHSQADLRVHPAADRPHKNRGL
uniref:C3H1-type domain-containing protein n=1 Tax=viral metagenome TaxID=1070528 RepID=A0A6C0KGA8_9ZZZZ